MTGLDVDSKTVFLCMYIQFVAQQVGFVTGDSDWRNFSCAAANSLRQPDTASALDNLINFLIFNTPNEDNGQWGILAGHVQGLEGSGSTNEAKLGGVISGFGALDGGAHNVDQWGALKAIAPYLM